MLAKNIAAIMALIGQVTLGIGTLLGQGLVIALNDWFRKAELTADRAGLLCVQDIEPCLRTFMKLAGGARPRSTRRWTSTPSSSRSAPTRTPTARTSTRPTRSSSPLYRTHPFPILRAKQLDAWHSTGYRELAGPRGLLGPASST